jgi:hypothetical protein
MKKIKLLAFTKQFEQPLILSKLASNKISLKLSLVRMFFIMKHQT